MAKINTVLGEIDSNQLGETLCHEHVVCVNPAFYNAFGEKWLPKEKVIERAVKLFRQAKDECGVSTIIDGTPIDLGRNVSLIKEVSQKSGVNILLSSGIYCNEERFLLGKNAEKLARFFIEECQTGIASTSVKPAILKCATGRRGLTEINEVLLNAMAITQKETKLPIFAHNEHNLKTPYEQLKIFEKTGVNLEKVVIGHCSDCYNIDYLVDLLKNGCYLGFDRIYPSVYKKQAETIAELIAKGYEDKILLSHDFFAFYDFADNDLETQKSWGRDFTTVHKKLLPKLRELGISETAVKKLTNDNPRKMLGGE
jgi:phosphotriesterase-related protein